MSDGTTERSPDQKFTVSVPKADNYFPVMRYKCGNDLRPVPIVRPDLFVRFFQNSTSGLDSDSCSIFLGCYFHSPGQCFCKCVMFLQRVQTRVRLEDDHWRVALQISSNPHNEDNLTDLTIIMGVPPVVKGESLTTSPPGGVWNASKRSVIWCVSELGGGEKFQLQARFEVEPDEDAGPQFPVLVRCQCMYAQLSDVEVEVSDIPEVFPADVRMKLARRFRLSHRERP
jgi:Muniscin C-terminal mu homology domain